MDDDYLAGQNDGCIRIDGLKYHRQQLIGQGRFGPVYQGYYVTPMGNEVEVAIKHIRYADGTQLRIDRNEELELRRSSSNITNFLHYFGYKKEDNLAAYLITELCAGSLKTYVEGGYHGPAFHLAEKGMLRQVVYGMAYLHKTLKTVHRDIKPVNLFISVRHNKPEMKIGDDYGLAKIFKTTNAIINENLVSTQADCIGWKAPELYDEDVIMNPTVDIFSLGCVFGYLLTGGKHPFGDEPEKRSNEIRLRTAEVILKRADLIKVSFAPSADHALDLISSMVQMDPDERPQSVDEISNHFYLHPHTLRKHIRQNRKKKTFDEIKAGAIEVYKGTYRYVGNLEYDEAKNVIAHGSSGTVVFFGKLRVEEGIEVAIKRLTKKVNSRKEKPIVPDEFDIIKEVKHPNILHYIWFELDEKYMYIATERCAGTLQTYVEGEMGSIPRFDNGEMEILYQVTLGLDYLHDTKIVHRDIKPVNILISIFNGKPQIKLADFGISRRQIEGQTEFVNTVSGSSKGTQGWMAPELYDSDVYTFAVDVFSLGCVFGYLLSGGKHPFGDFPSTQIKDKKPMLLKEEDLKLIDHCNNAIAFQLIERMVKMEPEERPTVKTVLNDQFFTSIEQKIQQSQAQTETSAATIGKSASIEMALEKLRLSLGDSAPTERETVIKNPAYEEPNYKTREFLRLCNSSDELEDNYNDDFMAQFVELVTDKNVDVNGLDKDGWTPAEILYRKYKHDNLSVLLELLRENDAVEQ